MNPILENEILTHARSNNVNKVKELLMVAGLRKKPKLLTNIFDGFKYLSKYGTISKILYASQKKVIEDLFLISILNKNIPFCKYLIESKELRINADIYDEILWSHAIVEGGLEFVKYLANHPKFKKSKQEYTIMFAIEHSTESKNLDTLKYLIDDSTMPYHKEVKKLIKEFYNGSHVSSTDFDDVHFSFFSNSCANNNKEWVDFLLNHSEYRKIIDKTSFYYGIENAMLCNHLDMLDYLLTNEKMPHKPYKDYDPQNLLKFVNKNISYELYHYLIFDFKIKKPEKIDSFYRVQGQKGYRVNPTTDIECARRIKMIEKLFEQRQLKEDLEKNLKIKSLDPSRLYLLVSKLLFLCLINNSVIN